MVGPSSVRSIAYRVGLFDEVSAYEIDKVCVNLLFIDDYHLTFYNIREVCFSKI